MSMNVLIDEKSGRMKNVDLKILCKKIYFTIQL